MLEVFRCQCQDVQKEYLNLGRLSKSFNNTVLKQLKTLSIFALFLTQIWERYRGKCLLPVY